MIPGTCSFKCKRKPDWNINKFKALYFVIGGVQKILYPETFNLYYLVVQWDTVSFMFILQSIIGLKSQIIDFTNYFSRADIPSGDSVFVELTMYFNSNGWQSDVVLRLNKILNGHFKAARLWYEKL